MRGNDEFHAIPLAEHIEILCEHEALHSARRQLVIHRENRSVFARERFQRDGAIGLDLDANAGHIERGYKLRDIVLQKRFAACERYVADTLRYRAFRDTDKLLRCDSDVRRVFFVSPHRVAPTAAQVAAREPQKKRELARCAAFAVYADEMLGKSEISHITPHSLRSCPVSRTRSRAKRAVRPRQARQKTP